MRGGVVMPNGLGVCPCLPYKCGSTTFTRLLLLILTGTVVENPHFWEAILRKHRIAPANCTSSFYNFSIVRNPYDRVVSYYYDKYQGHALLPPRMPKNLSLEHFVDRLVRVKIPAHWAVAPAHYAPLLDQWECIKSSVVYKIEEIDTWKDTLFQKIGATPAHVQRLNMSLVGEANPPKYKNLLTRAAIDKINTFARNDFEYLGYSLI